MPIPSQATLEPEPFQPRFSDDQLAAFKVELDAARVPPATYASVQPRYGITSEWMEETLRYWRTQFDWRKREAHINSVDHYTVSVDDQGSPFKLHFIASYSDDPAAIPLLLCHGWPGSVLEFIEVIKLLRASTNPAFHVICPSQPGYGWSDPPPLDRPTFGLHDVTRMMDNLMRGLGFAGGYAVQGGDIGSVIARLLANTSDACKAVNLNYLPLLPPASILPAILPRSITSWIPTAVATTLTALVSPLVGSPATFGLTERELKGVRKGNTFVSSGIAYGQMQATRPATIGIVLQSSPVALLAWLGEKFRDWTDEELPIDQLLEIVTFWYIQGTYPTSIYAYAELLSGTSAWHQNPKLFIHQPLGFSSFAHEIESSPRVWAAETGNLQFYRYHERGGHFAALERPEDFAQDMRDCFREIYPRDTTATIKDRGT